MPLGLRHFTVAGRAAVYFRFYCISSRFWLMSAALLKMPTPCIPFAMQPCIDSFGAPLNCSFLVENYLSTFLSVVHLTAHRALAVHSLVGRFGGVYLISEHGNSRMPNHVSSHSRDFYSCLCSSFIVGRPEPTPCAIASACPSAALKPCKLLRITMVQRTSPGR